jgi:hypothetical protein
MPTPAQWREASRLYSHAAEGEATPEIKRLLGSHACALAALAVTIERRERTDKFLREKNINRYRHMSAGVLDEKRGRRSNAAE